MAPGDLGQHSECQEEGVWEEDRMREKGQRYLGIPGGRETWRWREGFLEDEETCRERCLGVMDWSREIEGIGGGFMLQGEGRILGCLDQRWHG